jgi:hypothetical protein
MTKEGEDKIYTISEIVYKTKVSVLLGSPGSGKTTTLKHISNNSDIVYTTVKKYLRGSVKIDNSVNLLLLDGLDEYRVSSSDKAEIIEIVAERVAQDIANHGSLNVLISCRYMDWYGSEDIVALQSELNIKKDDISVYSINKLDDNKKKEFATKYGIDDIDEFVYKYDKYVFLDNPQMYGMCVELNKSGSVDISSKDKLYQEFVKSAKDINRTHKELNDIEYEELFHIGGYLAFYYIFGEVDEYSDSVVDEIASSENGYAKEKINIVLKSKIFDNRCFVHRSIAEYLSGRYIAKRVDTNDTIEYTRVKDIMIKSDKVPTELRGTFAWVSTLSDNKDMMHIDPYYQAIYSDNTMLNIEQKRKRVEILKEYEKSDPYYYSYWASGSLEGLYDSKLDDYYIDEYNATTNENYSYRYVLGQLFCDNVVSDKIREYVKVLLKSDIASGYKDSMIEVVKDDKEYLKTILDDIEDKRCEDNSDNLKRYIVEELYKYNMIDHKEYAKHLTICSSMAYSLESIYHGMEYEKQKDIAEYIFDKYADDISKGYGYIDGINSSIFSILEHFFTTLVDRYEVSLSARDILDILLSYYIKYYKHYKIPYSDKKLDGEKMQRLCDDMFGLFLDDSIKKNNDIFLCLIIIKGIFSIKFPKSCGEVIHSKMDKSLPKDQLKSLFVIGMNHLTDKKGDDEYIDTIVKEYDLAEVYNEYLYPKKDKYKIEHQKRLYKNKVKQEKIKEKNNAYFESKSDEEILYNINNLEYVSRYVYLKNDKKAVVDDFNRLKAILKQKIYHISDEEMDMVSLDILAKEVKEDIGYKITHILYNSLALNSSDRVEINDIALKRYMYTLSIKNSDISNIIKCNYHTQIENEEIEVAREAIYKIIEPYIKNLSIDDLKSMVVSKKMYMSAFVRAVFLDISLDDIDRLTNIVDSEKSILNALKLYKEYDIEKFDIDMATGFCEIVSDHFRSRFHKEYDSDTKVKIVHMMMSAFDTEKSIESKDGTQSYTQMSASFVRDRSMALLDINELQKLLLRIEGSIWEKRVLNQINIKKQQLADRDSIKLSINEIREFLLYGGVSSARDFFVQCVARLKQIKEEIANNRDNEKELFYAGDKAKIENDCRDVVYMKLQDRYKELTLTKERQEANNRVDINVKDQKYEIQIECKRDTNKELYNSIKDQLIDKYLYDGSVEYGVYLVFSFDKKRVDDMYKKIVATIPDGYQDRIEVIVIDLRR